MKFILPSLEQKPALKYPMAVPVKFHQAIIRDPNIPIEQPRNRSLLRENSLNHMAFRRSIEQAPGPESSMQTCIVRPLSSCSTRSIPADVQLNLKNAVVPPSFTK